MADTRKDRRAPVSLKVRFKSATVDEFIEHYCKDVSRGGIFIKSSQPMAIGTLLKFQFQLKDESSLIKGVGRVVWTRAPEDAVADQPAGMGIKFIKMDNESRAIVDRIVESHGAEPGAYVEGRATASEAETPSDRPEAPSENFFPQMAPAQLPPPEDRTAVRQAAQFLAAALAEGATDKAAAREAEQKAEEARQRTAQIEAQRLAEAQRQSELQTQAKSSDAPLPSMIVDPSLGASEGKPLTMPPAMTTVSSAPPMESGTPTTSFPPSMETAPRASVPPPVMPTPAEPAKKSPLLPAAILVGILAVAAWAYQRKPAEVETPLAPPPESAKTAEPAKQPEPTPPPSVEPAAPTTADVEADAAPEPAAPEPAAAEPEPSAEPAKLVELDVRTIPPGAEVLVSGEPKGAAPVKVQLAEGVASRVTARAPGYVESTQEITPTSADKKPLRFVLLPLPYVVRVNTTPPGAKISVGAKRGDAGQDIVLGTALKGMLGVTARLPGHELARAPLRPEDFTQTAENMFASVDLTLTPLPVPPVPAPVAAKPRVRPPAPAEGAAETAPAPSDAPASAEKAPASADAAPTPPPTAETSAEKPAEVAPEKPVAPAAPQKPIDKPVAPVAPPRSPDQPAAAPTAPPAAPTAPPATGKSSGSARLPDNPFG